MADGDAAVYPRDATFHVSYGTAYAFHWPTADRLMMARCNPRFTMLDDESPRDPAEVPTGSRCGRPGCRQAWQRWVVDQEADRG